MNTVRCQESDEPLLLSTLTSILSENIERLNGSIIDAGSNLGSEACLFAEVAPMSIVHAIDPMKLNIEKIKRTVARKHSNIKPMLGGLGSYERIVHVPSQKSRRAGQQISFADIGNEKNDRGGRDVANVHRLLKNTSERSKKKLQNFTVYRIDDLFSTVWRGETLSLAHFDVEGSEMDVLNGAYKTIRRDRPVFTCELHVHKNWTYSQNLIRFAEDLNYDAYMIDEICSPAFDCRNILFLQHEKRKMYTKNPSIRLAWKTRDLVPISSKNVTRFAFPCCRKGGACCKNKKTCCSKDALINAGEKLPSPDKFPSEHKPQRKKPQRKLPFRELF